jgi:hypothetical protein
MTCKVETEGLWFKGNTGRKEERPYLKAKTGMVVYSCNHSYERRES